MFTIEQAVENWKNDLRQKQTLMESDIEELESHLRDEMERLGPLGLTEEEAFVIAVRRIGDTMQIASEFAKVNTAVIWKNRFFWMIIGVLIKQLFGSCSNLLGDGGALLGRYLTGLNWLGTGILSPILSAVVLLVFFYIFYRITVKTSIFSEIKYRRATGIIIALVATSSLIKSLIRDGSIFIIAKFYGMEQFRQFTLGSIYSSIAISVIWPVVWLILLLWLMPRKTQTT